MSSVNFEDLKNKFINSDLDEKIRIYTTTEGLSVEQFKELLKYYPIQHLSKLENCLLYTSDAADE
nr:hypothetical protein [Clostridioides difficile]